MSVSLVAQIGIGRCCVQVREASFQARFAETSTEQAITRRGAHNMRPGDNIPLTAGQLGVEGRPTAFRPCVVAVWNTGSGNRWATVGKSSPVGRRAAPSMFMLGTIPRRKGDTRLLMAGCPAQEEAGRITRMTPDGSCYRGCRTSSVNAYFLHKCFRENDLLPRLLRLNQRVNRLQQSMISAGSHGEDRAISRTNSAIRKRCTTVLAWGENP